MKLVVATATLLVALSSFAQAQGAAAQQQPGQPLPSDGSASNSQSSKRAELLQQLAEIEKKINEAGGPRTRYIGPTTEDEPFKSYYKRFADRLEKSGTDRFPKKNGKPAYGSVVVNVYIDSRGRLKDVDVIKSDDPFLSTYSIGLLRSLKQFEAFSSEMAEAADRVVLTAKFNYQHVE